VGSTEKRRIWALPATNDDVQCGAVRRGPGLWVRVYHSDLTYRNCAESNVERTLGGFGVLGEPADAVGLQDVMQG